MADGVRTPQIAPGPKDVGIGITRYLTRTPGIGGVLKVNPESFRVDELSRYPLPQNPGRFTIARVEACDIEQNELFRRLSKALSLRPGSIGFAGTKDRRAITTQLLSIPAEEGRVKGLSLSGVRILETYRSSEPLYLGALYGNRFGITVHDVSLPMEEVLSRLKSIETELKVLRGFPNYYGPQRFGEVRPVTHLVGRALIKESVTAAVEAYLTLHAEGERSDGSLARAAYARHRDAEQALKEFPIQLTFERILLDRLTRGEGHGRAFHALPRHLRSLFVHAYQSYLFNSCLSLRIERGLSLHRPMEGDWLLRLGADGMPTPLPPIPVKRENLEEAERAISTGLARLSAPVVGTKTPPSFGLPGELLEEVLLREGVCRQDFHLNEAPELSSTGTHRALLAPMPLRLFPKGSPVTDGLLVHFSFSLGKGEYATVLLREFLKEGAG